MRLTKNHLISLLLCLLLTGFLLTGCDGRKKKAPIKTSSPSATIITSERPEDNGSGDDLQDEDSSIDDNTEDMYVKIYGDEFVDDENGRITVDQKKMYAEVLGMSEEKAREYYKQKLILSRNLEKEGRLVEAARGYRECIYVENKVFKKTGLAAPAIEKLKKDAFEEALNLKKSGRLKEALKYAEIAVICDPSSAEILKLNGELYSATGEEGLAIPFMAASLENNPKDSQLRYRLKNMYLLEGKPKGAIPLITPDIAGYTRLNSHWADLAEAYFMDYMMNPSKAAVREDVDKALTNALADKRLSKPGRTELKLSLALFHGKFKKALSILDEYDALDVEPAIETRIIYNRACINLALDKKAKASENFLKTMKRNYDHLNITQGENYMALMSAWALDVMGEKELTPKDADLIFSKLKRMDHSYRQEFGFIRDYLEARSKKDWDGAADAMVRLTKKRHLELIGDFVQDIVQVPAEEGMVYISMGQMYEKAGKIDKAIKCYDKVRKNLYLGYKAREHLQKLEKAE